MSGVDDIIGQGHLLVAVPLAVLAGLISFLSPCVLPLVPGYIAYVGGQSSSDTLHAQRRALWGSMLFVLGFSSIFIAYGAVFGVLGWWLIRWQEVLIRIMGVFVFAMGFVFVGKFLFFQRTFKTNVSARSGLWGAPVLGATFALGWTPCIGPTLAAISALSLGSGSPLRGAVLGFAYCVGLGIPFIAMGAGLSWAVGGLAFVKKHVRIINWVGGILLMSIGLLMMTGLWSLMLSQLLSTVEGFEPTL